MFFHMKVAPGLRSCSHNALQVRTTERRSFGVEVKDKISARISRGRRVRGGLKEHLATQEAAQGTEPPFEFSEEPGLSSRRFFNFGFDAIDALAA
jgi:hypothetical protein